MKIDDETRTKIDNDLALYGNAYGIFRPDDTLEHLPAEQVMTWHASVPLTVQEARATLDFASFTTKQLEAEVRRRRGYASTGVDAILAALPSFELGALGAVRNMVNQLWDNKTKVLAGLTPEEQALLNAKDFIGCVRAVRDRVGVGIADAKKLVDQWKGTSHGR